MTYKGTTMDCHHCNFRKDSLFCGQLKEKEIESLMENKKGLSFKPKQALFYQGNTAQGVLILCSGSIKVFETGKSGQKHILNIIAPGDIIDKSMVFLNGKHSSSAEAVHESSVSFFNLDVFNQILHPNNQLAINIINRLALEIEEARGKIRQLIFDQALIRLLKILFVLGNKFGVRLDENTVSIPLSLKKLDLAQMVGVRPESVIRLVTLLKRQEVISMSTNEITILDEEKLRQMCIPE